MTKRLIDIDDELLEAARAALGVETNKDTVQEALRLAGRYRPRADLDEVLEAFAAATEDLSDEEVMDAAWR